MMFLSFLIRLVNRFNQMLFRYSFSVFCDYFLDSLDFFYNLIIRTFSCFNWCIGILGFLLIISSFDNFLYLLVLSSFWYLTFLCTWQVQWCDIKINQILNRWSCCFMMIYYYLRTDYITSLLCLCLLSLFPIVAVGHLNPNGLIIPSPLCFGILCSHATDNNLQKLAVVLCVVRDILLPLLIEPKFASSGMCGLLPAMIADLGWY